VGRGLHISGSGVGRKDLAGGMARSDRDVGLRRLGRWRVFSLALVVDTWSVLHAQSVDLARPEKLRWVMPLRAPLRAGSLSAIKLSCRCGSGSTEVAG